jgi:hypothetical protein
MKLRIEPTTEFFMAGDVMVRAWKGTTEDGAEVLALVTAVCFAGQVEAVADGLVSIPAPDDDAARRWAEHILDRSTDTD